MTEDRLGNPESLLAPSLIEQLRSVGQDLIGIELPHPTRVAVDGFCGAGKTTVADALSCILSETKIPTIRVSADDFQNPPKIRWQLGPDSPEGFYRHAIDFDALKGEVLEPLGTDGSLRYRTSTYDIRTLRPNLSDQKLAQPSSIMIVDGLFLHDEALRGYFDYTIFVEASFEACIQRARWRNQEERADAEEVEDLYRRRYVPGFTLYLNEARPSELASTVIRNG